MVFRPSLLLRVFRRQTGQASRKSVTSRWQQCRWLSLIVAASVAPGCVTEGDSLRYLNRGDDNVNYYIDQAAKIDYPDTVQQSPDAVTTTEEPRRISGIRKDEIRDVSLATALRTSLENAEIIRDNAQFLNAGNRLLTNPEFASSIYDVAIQETNTLFGQGGQEAALSEFDGQFTTNMTWGRTEQISESSTIGFAALQEQDTEFGDFRSSLSKIFADGSSLALSHNWIYTGVNQRGVGARPFPSQFSSRAGAAQEIGLPTVGAEFRHPLLAGSGTEYTRVAGPIARRPTLQSTPTVNQGVVIARIRTDIAIADFEESVATLLKDVEDTYWDLYLAYRTYDAEMVSLQSALQTWREVKANQEAGKVGAADEAQGRDNYFEIKNRAQAALNSLLQSELRLRRLMGTPVNDGMILRPTDDPITAQILPDWNVALTEALVNRPELRRQKWNVKSLQLQYDAAKSLIRPRLDFVARYEVNGFGDRLFGEDTAGFRSAYGSLLQGEQTGWGLGFEFSMPIGFRGAHAQMQNHEHRLTKARAGLAQQELEVSYEMAAVFQQIDQQFEAARINFNRRRAAERRVQAFEAEYKVGRTTLDLLLRSQISLAQAEIAYFQSIVGYNRALNDLKFRKGTALVDNNVYLSEGMWTGEAYGDAVRRAWERSFAFENPRLRTEPPEFATDGVMYMPAGASGAMPEDMPVETHPASPSAEELPATPPVEGGTTPPPAPVKRAPDSRSAFRDDEAAALSPRYEEDFVAPQLPEDDASVLQILPASETRPSEVLRSLEQLPEEALKRTESAGESLVPSRTAVREELPQPIPEDRLLPDEGLVPLPPADPFEAPAQEATVPAPASEASFRPSAVPSQSLSSSPAPARPLLQQPAVQEFDPPSLEPQLEPVRQASTPAESGALLTGPRPLPFGNDTGAKRSTSKAGTSSQAMTRSQLLGRSSAAPENDADGGIQRAGGFVTEQDSATEQAEFRRSGTSSSEAPRSKSGSTWGRFFKRD